MKRPKPLFYNIVIFILAQVAWLSLLGLWIYWYVSNYMIFSQVGENLTTQIVASRINVFALVGGVILLVAISVGMSLIFAQSNSQIRMTSLYDNFIANVTHELKSPLASIQLYLETMSKHALPPEKQNEFLALMMTDVSRLNNLINAILEISRLEQKKIAHNYQVYNAGEVVRNLLEEAREQFKLPKEAVTIRGDGACRCVLDREAFKIVLNNLIDNAIKYSMDSLKLAVRYRCMKKKFVFEIQDNGVGIPPREQKKVFKKFHRVYDPAIPSVKGTGLGLYWVREIIKYHGGRVSVSSEGTNKGTTFIIELPIYQTSKKRYIRNLLKLSQKKKDRSGNHEIKAGDRAEDPCRRG